LQEYWVWVLLLVLLLVTVTALLHGSFETLHVRIELLLVDAHVHLLNEQTVSRHAVALLQKDDVTDDQVLHIDCRGGAILAAKYSGFLIHDLRSQTQELPLLAPVAEGLDQAGENDCEINRKCFNQFLVFGEDADDQADGGEDKKHFDV